MSDITTTLLNYLLQNRIIDENGANKNPAQAGFFMSVLLKYQQAQNKKYKT